MVERSALLASLTDSEKSVKNLVNDTNQRLTELLLPHQSIGEEWVNFDKIFPDPPVFVEQEPSPGIPEVVTCASVPMIFLPDEQPMTLMLVEKERRKLSSSMK